MLELMAQEDDQLRRLNESYYSNDPADYFRTRWQILLLAAARSDGLATLFAEGFEYEGVVVGRHERSNDDPSRGLRTCARPPEEELVA
jgi:hypothetical protein